MKYYIIAGEASGDLHASKLINSLSAKDPEAKYRIWGGDQMEGAAGITARRHLEELSFMGFAEVVKHLPKIFSNIKFCKRDILEWEPDVIIFVDFPGFNLRIAEWAKKKGFTTFYFIAPQVWAWKEGRIEKMIKYIDQLFVILPFEYDYFKSKGLLNVHYHGHPLKDEVAFVSSDFNLPKIRPKIALLPGSRKQEIKSLLPIFIQLVKDLPQMDFVVVCAPGMDPKYYDNWSSKNTELKNLKFDNSGMKRIMPTCDAALVASGTATLETALYGIPQSVAYKTSGITYQIAKRLIKVQYISLVNLIVNKPLIKEMIQSECNFMKLRKELNALLFDEQRRQTIKEGYAQLSEVLGHPGATDRIAESMVKALRAH